MKCKTRHNYIAPQFNSSGSFDLELKYKIRLMIKRWILYIHEEYWDTNMTAPMKKRNSKFANAPNTILIYSWSLTKFFDKSKNRWTESSLMNSIRIFNINHLKNGNVANSSPYTKIIVKVILNEKNICCATCCLWFTLWRLKLPYITRLMGWQSTGMHYP